MGEIISGMDIGQDAAGRYFVRESQTDEQGRRTRHSLSYATMEDLHRSLVEDTMQWLPWQKD